MGLRVGQLQASDTHLRRSNAADPAHAVDVAPATGIVYSRQHSGLTVETALLGLRRRLRDVALVVLTLSLVIEGLLLFRLWAQLSNRAFTAGISGFAYDLSNQLVAPFRSFEPESTVRATGILDMSTLVAIEVYLVAAIGALALLLFTNLFVRIMMAVRNRMHRRPTPLIYMEESIQRLPERVR